MLWNLGGQGGVQVVRMLGTLALATLLAPGDLGLMAMVWVVTGIAELFVDLGTGQAVIQRSELTPRMCSSVFWANVGFALVLGGLAAMFAPLISLGFAEPALAELVVAIAPVFVIASLGVVPSALLQRGMRFDRVARARMAGAVLTAATSISAAATGHGVWSMIYGQYVGAAAMTVVIWCAAGFRPMLVVSLRDLRAVAGFSLNLLGVNLTNFVFGQIDTVVIGRWFGRDVLGCYSLAKKIVLQPIVQAGSAVSNVLFARFARLVDDHAGIRARYLDASAALTAMLAPVALGIALVAGPFIEALAGERWSLVAPLVALLAPAALAAAVLLPTGALFRAVGRTDQMLRLGLARGGLVGVGVVLGAVAYGVGGTALGLSLAMLVVLPFAMRMPFRLIGLELADGLRVLRPVGGAAFALFIATLATREVTFRMGAVPLLSGVACVVVGGGVYVATLLLSRASFLEPLLGARFNRQEARA